MGKILLRQLILLPLLINSIRSHNIFILHVYKYIRIFNYKANHFVYNYVYEQY